MATKKKTEKENPSKLKTWFKRFFIAGMVGVFLVLTLFFSVLFGFFGALPNEDDLEKVKVPLASEIYAKDGTLLGKFYIQNRSAVKYKDISKNVINALIATEDHRFLEHKGVDAKSYLRVFFKTILGMNRSSGGGSTISQQLIKNLYKRESFGLLTLPVNKIKEAIVATRLERVYTKEDILTLYLNTVPYGELAYGIGTASKRFFNKTPKYLTVPEAATLIGLLKATTYYSPRRYPDRSIGRRNTVINQMVKNGFLSSSKGEEFKKTPLGLNYNKSVVIDGLAPHFRNVLRADLKKWTAENPMTNGKKHNIFTDGLKIYTTIDAGMQKHAEAAVATHMASLHKKFMSDWPDKSKFIKENWAAIESARKRSNRYKRLKAAGKSFREIESAFSVAQEMKIFTWNGIEEVKISPQDSIIHYLQMLNTGFVAMDPNSGEVKAWVGGINHSYFPEDKVTTPRQVGSTFKPFTYAAALQTGISACEYYPNELRSYSDYQNWTPKNAGNDPYGGFYSLQGALVNSVNTVAAQVIFQVGIDNVIELAQAMGIEANLPEVPSLTLGVADISPFEMVNAYCTFANGGYNVDPIYVTKITDKNGKLIQEWKPKNKVYAEKVLDDNTAMLMQTMMQKVVDDGTGKRLRWQYGLKNQIAGKTGTTQDQGDGWFVGYTPNLVAGAWVGSEDRRVHFRTLSNGQGSRTALPIFGEFMSSLQKDPRYAYQVTQPFGIPEFLVADQLECEMFTMTVPDKTVPIITVETLENDKPLISFPVFKNKKKKENKVPKGPTKTTSKTSTANKPKATKVEEKSEGIIGKWFKNYKDKRKEKKNRKKK